MNQIPHSSTLADIVKNDYRAAAVLERFGLDFCCNGRRSLADACTEKGIDAADVESSLNTALGSTAVAPDNTDQMELDALIDHILEKHHSYVKTMLPVLLQHTQKIASVHGENHPELKTVARIYARVHDELEHHMMKEEQILFPAIVSMVQSARSGDAFGQPRFGSVQYPIAMMESEHQTAGDELAEIKSLTGNYAIPADACATYTATMQELQAFELDLHRHIHLENNILHPKAIALERALIQAAIDHASQQR